MSSTTKEQLNELFMNLFGWMDRETTATLLACVAVAMVVVGIIFAIGRPHGIGGVLVLAHGLAWVIVVAIWYDRLPYTDEWQLLLGIIAAVALITSALGYWMSRKPTARECNVRVPLVLVACAYACFNLAFLLEAYYIFTFDEVAGPASAWYVLRFVRVILLLAGVTLAVVGSISGVILRARAKLPYRPFRLP